MHAQTHPHACARTREERFLVEKVQWFRISSLTCSVPFLKSIVLWLLLLIQLRDSDLVYNIRACGVDQRLLGTVVVVQPGVAGAVVCMCPVRERKRERAAEKRSTTFYLLSEE